MPNHRDCENVPTGLQPVKQLTAITASALWPLNWRDAVSAGFGDGSNEPRITLEFTTRGGL